MAAGLAVVGAALIGAAPAHALITSSTITVPANPTFVSVDMDGAEIVHVEGTVVGGTPGEPMDILCDQGSDGARAVAELTLGADGTTFATDVDVSAHAGAICHWRATSRNQRIESYWDFEGPVVGVSGHDLLHGSGPSAGVVHNHRLIAAEPEAYWVANSLSHCLLGLTFSVETINYGFTPPLLACSGITRSGDVSNLTVDGVPVWLPSDAALQGADGAATLGLPGITNIQRTFDPATGRPGVSWSEGTATCQPSAATCTSFAATPIAVDASTTSTHNGRVVRQALTWRNTGSTPATVGMNLDFALYPSAPVFKFPGEAEYGAREAGSTATFPTKLTPVYMRSEANPYDGTMWASDGGLAIRPRPDTWTFTGRNRAVIAYARTIPAGESFRLEFAFAQSRYVYEAEGSIEEAAELLAPALEITSGWETPTNPATVTGTVTDTGWPKPTVTVNGVSATVAEDGTWSAEVPVVSGYNRMTATVAGADGTIGDPKKKSISYQPPSSSTQPPLAPRPFGGLPSTSTPAVSDPTLAFAVLRSRKRSNAALVEVRCPSPGVLIGALRRANRPHGRSLGSSRISVERAGDTRLLVKLNQRGRVLLERRRVLKLRLRVTFRPSAGPAVAKTLRVSLLSKKTRG